MPIFKGADELLGIVFGTQQKNKRKISTKDNTQLSFVDEKKDI